MNTTSRADKTIFTTPSDTEIVATRDFDAPRRLVWAVFTEPKHVSQWMLGPDGWTMPVCEIDLRPGGKWRWVWRKGADGSEMEMTGEYREVVPNERLVNTERWGPEWPETTVTTEFIEQEGRTRTVTTVVYPTKEARDAAMKTGMESGWSVSHDRLDGYLRSIG
jgi:uncharacterized protein YndB with AHSA1/START domain